VFERIGIERAHCCFCGTYGLVAVLVADSERSHVDVAGCERCWRATHKAADLLHQLRPPAPSKGKRTPNKTRKPASEAPRSTEPYRGPSKHEVGSLVPPAEERTA